MKLKTIRQWYRLLRLLPNYAKDLNRRATVEQQILDCIGGLAPMPDKEKLQEWVVELGIPEEFRNE